MGDTPARRVGIIGGGQLGRMLSAAASRLGIATHIYAPEADPIAGMVAAQVTTADYLDEDRLVAFATSVDVVTFEFENIPARALEVIAEHAETFPRADILAISQDRLTEKEFLRGVGCGTAPYARVDDEAGLARAVEELGVPSIVKTRRFGYDGHGQRRITRADQVPGAWAAVAQPDGCILEGFVDFDAEISVIGARSRTGEVVCFDPGENVHRDGILRVTTVPANVPEHVLAQAVDTVRRMLDAVDYVGVMGVEFFVAGHELLVNELAPRVHNSGHWTQNGCTVDQFEQHIRAVAGLPLGSGRRHADVVMTNLLGDDLHLVDGALSDPDVAVHLYGKAEARPGRKMGHLNRVTCGDFSRATHP